MIIVLLISWCLSAASQSGFVSRASPAERTCALGRREKRRHTAGTHTGFFAFLQRLLRAQESRRAECGKNLKFLLYWNSEALYTLNLFSYHLGGAYKKLFIIIRFKNSTKPKNSRYNNNLNFQNLIEIL